MVDLHIHTRHSDGTSSIEEILQEAERIGMKTIAITDHDCIDALLLIDKENRKLFSGEIIDGIEFSAMCDGTVIHILGYGIDKLKVKKHSKPFSYSSFVRFFVKQAQQIQKKLFLPVVKYREGTNAFEYQAEVERTHKKEFTALDSNLEAENSTWWNGYINPNSPLYIDFSEFYKNYDEIIKIIKDCGGLAFLAHPHSYKDNMRNVMEKVLPLVDGIECFHHSSYPTASTQLVEIAKEKGLLISGGSDYHGTCKPDRSIGCIHFPAQYVKWVQDIAKE